MFTILNSLIFLAAFYHIECVKLPQYIKQCSIKDPKLNDCVLEKSKAALPSLFQGDPKYHVPSFIPLEIDEILLENKGGLSLTLSKAKISGIENVDLKYVKLKSNGTHYHFKSRAIVPKLDLVGQYTVKGRILVLPIHGHGPCQINIGEADFHLNHYYQKVERKGEEYLELVADDLKFDCKSAHFQFDNLFDGDERLGREMNNMLNTNWREVINDLRDAVTQSMLTVLGATFKGIFDRVPVKDIFL